MAEGSDFALELMVGIQDMFTQKAKQIDAEVNKLEKDTTQLQKTFDDVSSYQKATKALEDLMRAGDASAEDIKNQEKTITDLAKSLKKAGVDINNVTQEEARLSRQMKETNSELQKRSGMKDMIVGGVTAVASSGLLKNFMSMADKVQKAQIEMRKLSNYSMDEITSTSQRNFIKNTKGRYNIEAGEIMGVQTLINQQTGLKGTQNQQASDAALKLSKLTNYDQEEVVSAISPLIRSGVSPEKATALIYDTFKKTGDQKHDLLDTVQEYYANLHSSGLSVEQFFAALQAGQRAGVFNYDKIGDSLKETFNARLSDQGMMQTLLGHGKTKGVIEEITDSSLKYKFRNALENYQQHLASGQSTAGDVGSLYSILGEIGKKNPLALRDISEQIGGTILAEDSGKKAAAPIGNAILNSGSVLGNYLDSTSIDPKELLTTQEHVEAAQKQAMDGLENGAADATKQLNVFADALGSLSSGISGEMNSHPLLTAGGMGLLGLGLAGGKFRGLFKLLGGARSLFGMGGAAAAAGEAVEAGGILSRTAGVFGRVGRIGGRWLGPAGQIAAGGLSAYSDYQQENMRGVAGDVGGTLGGLGAGAAAGAAVGSVVPVVGTAIGGLIGGALGYWGGDKLGSKLYDWFTDDDDKSQKRMTDTAAGLPSPDAASADSTTASFDGLNINLSQPINIQAMTANPDDISKALQEALRQSNPELIQSLEYALSQLMSTNDHQRPSN